MGTTPTPQAPGTECYASRHKHKVVCKVLKEIPTRAEVLVDGGPFLNGVFSPASLPDSSPLSPPAASP